MANAKITDLSALTATAGDEVPINRAGSDGKVTVEDIAALAGTPTAITVANEATDTTCFPLFVTAATGDLGPKTVSTFTLNSNTGAFGATSGTFGSVLASSNDSGALGVSGTAWSDLFLASGGVINFLAGDATITHVAASGSLVINADVDNNAASSVISLGVDGNGVALLSGSAFYPGSNDGCALGIVNTNAWSDLHLASGGVINWNNSNVTVTHTAGTLTTNAALVITDGFNSLTLGSQTWTFNGSSLGDTLLLSSGGSERLRIIDKGISTENTAIFKLPTAATFQFGNSDAASPVAQTLRVQNVSAGTADTKGADFTVAGSRGTGTGAGGAVNIQIAVASTAGSSQNALATVLSASSAGSIICGAQAALSTAATDGYLYIPATTAAAAGVPTAYTGKVAIVYNSSLNTISVYNGSWRTVAVT
jgi:hypothetical protein